MAFNDFSYTPINKQIENADVTVGSSWAGAELKSVLYFLALPVVFLVLPVALGLGLSKIWIYTFASLYGVALLIKSMRNPEYLLAIFALYMPLSKMIPISILPNINGTNILLLLCFIIWAVESNKNRQPFFRSLPATGLMAAWGIITILSGVTAVVYGGISHLLKYILEFKGWIDHFVVFFIFANLIRDGKMARRMVIYLMMGTFAVFLFGIDEMLEKAGRSSIEKSRVLGPHLQPNDFGAFLAYNAGPFIGLFLMFWRNVKVWPVMPFFLLLLKLLLVTFSRGAMLGFLMGGAMAAWTRSIAYVVTAIGIVIAIVLFAPQLLPESALARFKQTQADDPGTTRKLDKSSDHRLILWGAAVEMTKESPVFGKGFKRFAEMKGQYTIQTVEESDTHNMYLYVSSQMGIPALILMLLIIFKIYWYGRTLYKYHPDSYAKAIGLGGASMAAAVAVVNIFGSRIIGINTMGYVWIYLAIMSHLLVEIQTVGFNGVTKYGTK